MSAWPVETITDSDRLYMRVHRGWYKRDGTVGAGAFQDRDGGMSTDWAKYATPGETRSRHKSPLDNAIVAFIVGDVRVIPGQTVAHSPLPDNRAHTDVLGEKDEEARVRLRRIATTVLPLSRVAL